MKKRREDTTQLDLLEWAANRPTATILDALPGIARRLWRERHMQQPNNPPRVIPLKRQA